MQDAKAARPEGAARIVTGWLIVCGALLAAAPAIGQTAAKGQGAAIVYSGAAPTVDRKSDLASKPMPVLPTPSVAPGVFNDATASKPSPSVPSSAALDIRPGAFKSSYGPMPSTLAKPTSPAPAGLVSRPIAAPAASASSAAPYAGAPYQVEGKWFVPMNEPDYNEVGIASWYGPNFHGKAAATGEIYDQMAMTAAHPTLPIPSLVRVTNLENGKSVIVRLNDRGPFVDDRIIDMSKAAALALEMTGKGTAKVRVQYVGPVTGQAPAQSPTSASFTPAPQPQLAQAAAEATAPTPALKAAPTTGFFLQAGAFADLANAYALRDKLAAAGPASIVEGQSNGQRLYRVMVGPWASRDEAERAQDRMANAGVKSLVVAKN